MANTSIPCEWVSSPFGLALFLPLSRQARSQTIAGALAFSNRAAAAVRDMRIYPAKTAADNHDADA